MVRTGATWVGRSAFWAGQVDDNLCKLCGEAKETSAHTVWTCKALHAERCEADKLLADCGGELNLPAAVQHGIAPAMAAEPRRLFYGGEAPEGWSAETKRLFGKGVGKAPFKAGQILKQFEQNTVAREVIQFVKGSERLESIPMPAACTETVPGSINVSCDGSLKNPRGNHWKIWGLRGLVAERQEGRSGTTQRV